MKIKFTDDGDKVKYAKWCATVSADAVRSLCRGDALGIGESAVIFESKNDGTVTCPHCIEILKELKKYKY